MAADVTSGCTISADTVGSKKYIYIETATTADATDYFTVTLADYGAKTVEAVDAWTHSTSDSIIINEEGTTSVTSGVITFTIGGSTDNKKRVVRLICNSA